MGLFGPTIGATPTVIGAAFSGNQIIFDDQDRSLDLATSLQKQIDGYVDAGDPVKSAVGEAFASRSTRSPSHAFANLGTATTAPKKANNTRALRPITFGAPEIVDEPASTIFLGDLGLSKLREAAETANKIVISEISQWNAEKVIVKRSVRYIHEGASIRIAFRIYRSQAPNIHVSILFHGITNELKISYALSNILRFYRSDHPHEHARFIVTNAGISEMDSSDRLPRVALNDRAIFTEGLDLGFL